MSGLSIMPSEGVQILTEHLASLKKQHKEKVDTLTDRAKELEAENQSLKAKLEACLDELDFRNGQIEQLKIENTQKWRIEERNDWKSLVDSVQRDRDELQEENERLRTQLAAAVHKPLGGPRRLDLRIDAGGDSADPLAGPLDEPLTPLTGRDGDVCDPGTPRSGGSAAADARRRLGSPTTMSLRRELEEARIRLDNERTFLEQERREAQRLRQELDARRQREQWQQSSGILYRLVHLTRLWHRNHLPTPILNV